MSSVPSTPIDLHGLGRCAACGHDPACGWSQVGDDWLCHDDDHSCYVATAAEDPSLPAAHPAAEDAS